MAASFAFAVTAAPSADGRGWEEVHQTSEDVRVKVGPDGVAMVQHHLRYRVVAGHFKELAFSGLDPHAELVGESTILPEKGGEIAARVEPNPKTPGAVRITFDEPRSLGRGVYVLDVKYRLDLVAMKMFVRDGAMWRLSWTAPASPEGHDGSRVVFEIPSAPTEPRLASPDQSQTTLATLRRDPERDELELVRAHVPRGEAVTWSARVDPKAFPQVTSPELRPPVTTVTAAPLDNHVPFVLVFTTLAVLGAALAMLLRAKQDYVVRACNARFVRARPLVPVRFGLGPFAYGGAMAGAFALFLWGTPLYGAALVVVAMALGAHRSPAALARPRGPGRWRAIPDEVVLVAQPRTRDPGDVLDLGTRAGSITALVTCVVLAGLAFVLRLRVPGAALAIPLTAAALVPLFATGGRSQLPSTSAELAPRVLGAARDMLGRLVDLSHLDVRFVARFGEGTQTYDEVRLACEPADRIPGLRTIELAMAAVHLGSSAALPEVLVRFDDGSPAASKVAQIAPGLRVVPGRSPEEKVLRLAPRTPTPAGAARLLARLVAELEGRRATDRAPLSAVDAKHSKARRPGFFGAERGGERQAERRPERRIVEHAAPQAP